MRGEILDSEGLDANRGRVEPNGSRAQAKEAKRVEQRLLAEQRPRSEEHTGAFRNIDAFRLPAGARFGCD
jgi:hypothetical protein